MGDAVPGDFPCVAVLPHERVLEEGEPEVGRVLSRLARALLGPRDSLLGGLEVAAAADVAVAELPGAPDRRLHHPAEVDRRARLLRGPRGYARLVEAEDAALVREMLAGPGLAKDLRGLAGPAHPLLCRNAEHPELLLAPAETEPENEPAARKLVHDGSVLGQSQRVVERREHHPGAEPDPLGDRGDAGEYRK